MRNRRPALDHTEAVARRLAALSAELEAERAAQALQFASVDDDDGQDDDGQGDEGAEQLVERTAVRVPVVSAVPFSAGEAAVDTADDGADAASPGRHAARRRAAWEPPPALTSRLWGPGQVGVALGGVVLALAVTCLWLLFGTTQEAVTPLMARVEGAPSTTSSAAPSAAASSSQPVAVPSPAAALERAEVVVDVAGKVKRPGLVVLPSGARVADALERAGGARPGVDLTGINLARVLADGEQILVGVEPAVGTGATVASPAPAGDPGTSGPISLNSADAALLDTLPGVGPVTAAAIIDWRTQHGGFADVRDLLEVKGIGEATLAELLPHVTL